MKIDVMIIVGVVVGLLLGAVGGYFLAPKTDATQLEIQISDLEASQSQLQTQIHNLQVQATEYDTQVQQLNQTILDTEADYEALLMDYDNLDDDKVLLQTILSQKNAELVDFYNQVNSLNTIIALLESEIVVLESEIVALSNEEEIEHLSTSFSYSENITSELKNLIDQANSTIRLMVTKIETGILSESLIGAYNRSVDVKVIIDSNEKYTHQSAFVQLFNASVDIRGDNNIRLLHHKIMVIDSSIAITGSYDWTTKAELIQEENIIVLNHTDIAAYYITEFDRVWEQTVTEELYQLTPAHYVVINEVDLNPPGVDEGSEWVELYNPTDVTIDLSRWWIMAVAGTSYGEMIAWNTTIEPKGFLVIESTERWFDNVGDIAVLMDSHRILIDSTPVFTDYDDNEYSWQRILDGYDSDMPYDWTFTPSTKGETNIN